MALVRLLHNGIGGLFMLLCRQDALAASTALHSQVEQLKGELAAESTSISHLRRNVSAAAQQEAQTVAQLQGQVGPRRHVHVVIRSMPEARL